MTAASDPVFDTNVLVYAFVSTDPRRDRALDLLRGGGRVTVQSLNEFTRVSVGKLKRTFAEVEIFLGEIEVLCGEALPLTTDVHRLGFALARDHGLHIFGATVVAAAIGAGAPFLLTEDLQHGRRFGELVVENPFR